MKLGIIASWVTYSSLFPETGNGYLNSLLAIISNFLASFPAKIGGDRTLKLKLYWLNALKGSVNIMKILYSPTLKTDVGRNINDDSEIEIKVT